MVNSNVLVLLKGRNTVKPHGLTVFRPLSNTSTLLIASTCQHFDRFLTLAVIEALVYIVYCLTYFYVGINCEIFIYLLIFFFFGGGEGLNYRTKLYFNCS